MPQTSPMNWMILSLSMIMAILHILISINEKTTQKITKKTMINLTTLSWNW